MKGPYDTPNLNRFIISWNLSSYSKMWYNVYPLCSDHGLDEINQKMNFCSSFRPISHPGFDEIK